MPNIKSAKKRVLVTEAKTRRNKAAKSELKTAVKKFQNAVENEDGALAKETYTAAVKKMDKAVAKGLVHKNKAARKKSQFTKALNKLDK